MSYSIDDKFFIDTSTSIATLEGNLDLLNNIRFGKTDTESGITIQTNFINTTLTDDLTSLLTIDNYTNSNDLIVDIVDSYTSNNNTYVILQLNNRLIDTRSLTIGTDAFSLSNNNITPGKVSINNTNSTETYQLYKGQLYHLDYKNYYVDDYFVGYTSNIILSEETIYIKNNNRGYIIKGTSIDNIAYTHILESSESYFSSIIQNTSNDIQTGVYKNNDSITEFYDLSLGCNVYQPNISLPITQTKYYPFIHGYKYSNSNLSFLKYYSTEDVSIYSTYPRITSFENKNFMVYFLTRTGNVSTTLYNYNKNTSVYVSEKTIPGTSFANTFQYILNKFNENGSSLWSIRIVLKNIDNAIKDAIQVIHHDSDNSFTVSIVNNRLTDIVIYNTDSTTTLILNIYNIVIHFNENGIYDWHFKVDTLNSYHPNKNTLKAYQNNTFLLHGTHNINLSEVDIYNSDGTVNTVIYNETNEIITAITQYNLLGKAQQVNYYKRPYYNTSNYYGFINQSYDNSTNIVYSMINTMVNSNQTITYTNSLFDTTTRYQNANSIDIYSLNFVSNEVTQKQLNFGEDIKLVNFRTENMKITGDVTIDQDLYVQSITVNSNLILTEGSKIGIGTTPRVNLDVAGDALVSANVGIGTTFSTAALTINALNKDVININSSTIIPYPSSGFYNGGYTQTNRTISIIDNSNDIQLFPPLPGATYGAGTYVYTSSPGNSKPAANAFDNFVNNWVSKTSYNASTGRLNSPISTDATTPVSGSNIYGEWVQIKLPKLMSMANYNIYTSGYGHPRIWTVVGSNSSSNAWAYVDKRWSAYTFATKSGTAGNANFVVNTNSDTRFEFYRIIISEIKPDSGVQSARMEEWQLYLNNVNTYNYNEFKFNTGGYKILANSIYHYYYNDSNSYLPVNLLDTSRNKTLGYWRSGSNLTNTTDAINPIIIETDIINEVTITGYSFKGISFNTYPTKWTLEGSNSSTQTWQVLNNPNPFILSTVSSLNNDYTISGNTLSTSNYRFTFFRVNSTTPQYLELDKISFNIQTTTQPIYVNSNSVVKINNLKAPGSVIQTVYSSNVTRTTISSTSFTPTNITGVIVPKFSDSYLYVSANVVVNTVPEAYFAIFAARSNSTDFKIPIGYESSYVGAALETNNVDLTVSLRLYVPAETILTHAFQVYIRGNVGGNIIINPAPPAGISSYYSDIIIQEIAT